MKVFTPTRHELENRLDKIVSELGVSLHDLRTRAESGNLRDGEWAAWEEVESLLFLLSDAR